MTTHLLFAISFLLPFLTVLVLVPSVSALAKKGNIVDEPNFRKKQKQPVSLLGGTLVMSAICIGLIVMNVFASLNNLFPTLCVLIIICVVGLIDDVVDMHYGIKFVIQIGLLLLLIFGAGYRATSLGGLIANQHLGMFFSVILSIFLGVLYLNAINFMDGIDGLASSFGVLFGLVVFWWCTRHGIVDHAILALVFSGALSAFFLINVFSKNYKMYLGDSGSLVIGMFVYMSACINSDRFPIAGTFLTDRYVFSFVLALCSYPILDLVRVCIGRMLRKKSPFLPDRTHLHHCLVDFGYSHLMTDFGIIMANSLVILVWLLTARTGMNDLVQCLIVLLSGIILIWTPYYLHAHWEQFRPVQCAKRKADIAKLVEVEMNLTDKIRQIIDGKDPVEEPPINAEKDTEEHE